MNIYDESTLRAGDRLTVSVLGMEIAFRYCPPGTFVHKKDDGSSETIKIEKGYWIGETVVPMVFWNVVDGPVLTSLNADDYRESLGGGYPAQFLKLIAYLNLEYGVPGFSYVVPNAEQWDYARRAGKADYPPCDQHPWGLCASKEYEIFSTGRKTRDGEVICRTGDFDSGRMWREFDSELTLEEEDSGSDSLRLALVRNENSFQADAISFTIERNGQTMDVDVEELQAGDRMIVDGGEFGKELAFRFCPPGDFVIGCAEEEIREAYGQKPFGGRACIPTPGVWEASFYHIKKTQEGSLPRGFWLAERALPFSTSGCRWNDHIEIRGAFCCGKPLSSFIKKGWELFKVDNCLCAPPTEVQWEYACRYGKEWGLENMTGEIWQLCEDDEYNYYMYGLTDYLFRGGPRGRHSEKNFPSVSLSLVNTYGFTSPRFQYSDPQYILPPDNPPIGIRLALRIRGYASYKIAR